MVDKKIRLGVVGGSFGSAFYWHEHPNCIVEAVSDLQPEWRDHLKNIYKCDKAYDTLEELLADSNIDAVAVFTPGPYHVQHSVMAMNAGKHVISAVPAATTLEDAQLLLDTVKQIGLTYMMAETSYYVQPAISARKFYKEGKFGEIFYTEAEYHHSGLETLFTDSKGNKTWRYGYPPMLYPTHSTAFITGITGERLVEVSCIGWGNGSKPLIDNAYDNPFWNETAFFKTDKGHSARIAVYWYGAHLGAERAQWFGDKMSFLMPTPYGQPAVIVQSQPLQMENYEVSEWFKTDMLPESMRHGGGHDGAKVFITHEFIDALVNERKPTIDIYEALAYTVPGIIAHESAMRDGERMKVPSYGSAS